MGIQNKDIRQLLIGKEIYYTGNLYDKDKRKSYHFGHSLGLEIHESPNAAPGEERIMPVGAVVSAEPGIYLPGRFGVRIEDVIVLSETGCRDLTKSPKELIVL